MHIRTAIRAGVSTYQIQSNDTITTIAENLYGVFNADDVIQLYSANKQVIGVDPCHLPAGEFLYIPSPPPPAPIPPSPMPPGPMPPPPYPHHKDKQLVGACKQIWGNGVCLYKECPYPPFQLPC